MLTAMGRRGEVKANGEREKEEKGREGKSMKGEMAQDVYNTVSLYRGHHLDPAGCPV